MSTPINSYAKRAQEQAKQRELASRQDAIERNRLLERIAVSLETIVQRLDEQ